jgi:hypothetical protein
MNRVFLPFVGVPPVTYQPLAITNGSFEEGWTDLPPTSGWLVNQQPVGWTLTWVEPGQPIYDSTDVAGGIPECVHKLAEQLPPDEQPGGPDALILDGTTTYKIFHGGSAFGAQLQQTITGLRPGQNAALTAPIRAHLHGDPDWHGAEFGVWVNGVGHWLPAGAVGDRTWGRPTVYFVVPDDGVVEVVIRVKSKWPRAKDFFIDNVTLVARP